MSTLRNGSDTEGRAAIQGDINIQLHIDYGDLLKGLRPRPPIPISPYIALYRLVLPCIALYRLVSPCIALYRLLSPCIALYRFRSPCIKLYYIPYIIRFYWLFDKNYSLAASAVRVPVGLTKDAESAPPRSCQAAAAAGVVTNFIEKSPGCSETLQKPIASFVTNLNEKSPGCSEMLQNPLKKLPSGCRRAGFVTNFDEKSPACSETLQKLMKKLPSGILRYKFQ